MSGQADDGRNCVDFLVKGLEAYGETADLQAVLFYVGLERDVTDNLLPKLSLSETEFMLGPFSIPLAGQSKKLPFAFDAPTTTLNVLRLLRALQVCQPLLSPSLAYYFCWVPPKGRKAVFDWFCF